MEKAHAGLALTCRVKGALAPSVHASLNCYNFFVTQAIYIKVYIFLKSSV